MLFANDLTRITWQCLHFTSAGEGEQAVIDELECNGFKVFNVDGASIKTKEQLLSAVAKEMNFPDYFGMNWDALHECLRDMEWLPAKGYVLFVRNGELFWQRANRVAGTFVEIWSSSAEEWSREGKPFHLVFLW